MPRGCLQVFNKSLNTFFTEGRLFFDFHSKIRKLQFLFFKEAVSGFSISGLNDILA